MRFWDTSAIMPLLSREPLSGEMRRLLEEDAGMVVWWATRVECISAISRHAREGSLGAEGEASARGLLEDLSESWTEARPGCAPSPNRPSPPTRYEPPTPCSSLPP